MKMNVLGIQYQDYVSRKTGKPVKGYSLYCSFKDSAVIGLMTDSVWVSDSLDCVETGVVPSLVPGDIIDVEYNRRGSVADIRLVQTAAQRLTELANASAPVAPEAPTASEASYKPQIAKK